MHSLTHVLRDKRNKQYTLRNSTTNGKTDRQESLLQAAELCLQLQKCVTVSLWSGEVCCDKKKLRSPRTPPANLILFLTYHLICLEQSSLSSQPRSMFFLYQSCSVLSFCLCVFAVCRAEKHTLMHTRAYTRTRCSTLVIMQSRWICVCKWGRSGLLVSQRDWPALQQVDSRSRSQSQWLVSHLPPLPFTPRNNFDTLPVCLTPLAVGDLWLAGSLTLSPVPPLPLCSHGCGCSAWKCAHLSQLDCEAILQGWHLLFIASASLPFLSGQEDTGIFLQPCSFFFFFLTFQTHTFFLSYLLLLFPCALFYFFPSFPFLPDSSDLSSSLITFVSTFAPTCSLLDSTPVNLALIVLCAKEK